MRILLVAADAMEFRGVLRWVTDLRPARLTVDWARLGRLGGNDVLLAANGAGWKRAAEATSAAIGHFAPDAVVSTGFCGALDEKLRPADVVVAREIRSEYRSFAVTAPIRAVKSHHEGLICSIDHVARTAAEKRQLRAGGACAVEMEAAGVGERAQAAGLPFYCVRAVTDTAGENMTNDFNTALRGDGHFDTMLILKGLLRHPSARIPELARLAVRSVRASRSLGDFFADCGF
jgi:adenosylhomocysteine nucleosidase